MLNSENLSQYPHSETAESLFANYASDWEGLSPAEARERLTAFGPNNLPQPKLDSILQIFIHQFKNPLIYVLLVAAILSLVIKEWSDAIFIMAVLLINAIIGTVQEHSAQRAAQALQNMVSAKCRVVREGEDYEIDSTELVPGDIVLLESGDKIPADMRLLACHELKIDESLLTGESVSVAKKADMLLDTETVLAERLNMAFSATLVERGRGRGLIVNTGLNTELGQIAADVLTRQQTKAPLIVRMEKFTRRIAFLVLGVVVLLAIASLTRGMPLTEVFLLAVALAVSAIPEGLPVALTVALAVGMHRMAKRNVIVRKLVAVESLGSCTFIATDKTGTLTVNQLTVRRIDFPQREPWQVSGEGLEPIGLVHTPAGAPDDDEEQLLSRLYRCAILPNEGLLARRNESWTFHGDAVDVALLVLAHKAGVVREEEIMRYPELDSIPFEPENLFAASVNQVDGVVTVHVKGAVEKLLPMCHKMATNSGDVSVNITQLEQQAVDMAQQGFRVLAFASGEITWVEGRKLGEEQLQGLTFLGLVGMIDPLRQEAMAAVAACREAGIEVAMVTGDNPATALAIARELDLASDVTHVLTGTQLKQTEEESKRDTLIMQARVFARVEPHQKLEIVQALQRNKHFVAVSGDGANDAPALKIAEVGVAMGKSGTALARETADIVISDDNFSSIVAGIEEGRVAYANVRKVIFLLISTGAAEIVLFTLSLFYGLPIPLLAVQLLWLNLVTNGIQDVALAFEPKEGDELKRPPRSPDESLFNRLMVERVIISALFIGISAFMVFKGLLASGMEIDSARNSTLLLMVLFENVHVFNSRSETRSAFRHNPVHNRLLLFGTLGAQLIHIIAMYIPGIKDVLRIHPVSIEQWLELLLIAIGILLVMELHKFVYLTLQKKNK